MMREDEMTALPTVLLCAETESLANPRLLGLEDACWKGCPWLLTTSSAIEARKVANESASIEEVWIASSDEMTALNLAAAIRKDRASIALMLVAFSPTGSFLSNAVAVGADDVLTEASFPKRFLDASRSQGRQGLHGPKRADDAGIPAVIGNEAGSVRLVLEDPAKAEAKEGPATQQAPCEGVVPPQGAPEPPRMAGVANKPRMAPSVPARPPDALPTLQEAVPARPTMPVHAVPSVPPPPPVPASRGLLVPVVSGSGGTGKSAMAAVIATLLAQEGLSVLAIDLDLQFGDLHRLLGCEKPLGVDEAIADGGAVRELRRSLTVASSAAARPALISAPARVEQAEAVLGHVGPLLEACTTLFDAVVANTGAAWGEQHALLLERGTSPIFLMDQRSSSVFACKHALALCTRMGIATRSFAFALNRCSRTAPFSGIDAAMALHGAHVLEVRDGGQEVEELLGAGMADELCSAKNDMVRSTRLLLDGIGVLGPAEHAKKEEAKAVRAHRPGKARGRRKQAADEPKAGALELLSEGLGLASPSIPSVRAGA